MMLSGHPWFRADFQFETVVLLDNIWLFGVWMWQSCDQGLMALDLGLLMMGI